jgi:acyl-coenzyme A thioesterase PaaI-like protein
VKAEVPLVAAPTDELDESPFVRRLRVAGRADQDLRLGASDLGGGGGQLGALAAAAVLTARSRMAQWQLHHGLERSSTASVQVTLFGRADFTGTLGLSTTTARRSEGRGFCDVHITEERGRRAGLGTVVLAAGPPSITNDLDVDGRAHESAVLTLIDAAATRAFRAATGSPRRVLAVSLHASVLRPLPVGELSPHAVVRTCDGQSAWCDVEVVGLADGRPSAIGTVVALV